MASRSAGVLVVVSIYLALVSAASPAVASCSISGACSVARNVSYPGMGAWQYTLTLTWDTGTRYALSHVDIILTPQNSSCGCQELAASLQFPTPAGTSTGNPNSCAVTYDWILGCNGDPSIHLTDLVMKLEPRDSSSCSPGTVGQGTFTFFSEYPPAQIAERNMVLVDKFGQLVCYGQLTGVFPGLPCDPTAAEPSTWGAVKSLYTS
jgi:hypothetical protein